MRVVYCLGPMVCLALLGTGCPPGTQVRPEPAECADDYRCTEEAPEFASESATLGAGVVTRVSDMVGQQIFLHTCNGRVLVTVREIAMYRNAVGLVTLGRLVGDVVWGEAGVETITSDHRERLAAEGWEPIEELAAFTAGVADGPQLQVSRVELRALQTNDYAPLVLSALEGRDLSSGALLSYDNLDEIECASYWEWRCVNTACSTCDVNCDCTTVGFCNWAWLPNCMRINCPRRCVLSGFWDWCDC